MAVEEVDASLRSFGSIIWSTHQDDSDDVTNQITLIIEPACGQDKRTETRCAHLQDDWVQNTYLEWTVLECPLQFTIVNTYQNH